MKNYKTRGQRALEQENKQKTFNEIIFIFALIGFTITLIEVLRIIFFLIISL